MRFYDRGDTMHEIGTDQQAIRTALLQIQTGLGQTLSRLGPALRILQSLNVGKIKTMQHKRGRVQPAQGIAHTPIDLCIIGCGGFPTQPANQPDGLHRITPKLCPCCR